MSRTKHRCFMITVRPHGCMTDDQIAEVRLKIESTYAHYHLVEEFANETLPETRHVHALLFLPEDKASTVSKFNEKWRRFLKPWEKDTETQVRIAFQGSFVYDEKALEYITPETEKNNEKKEKGGKTVILKSQLPDDLEEYYSDPPKKKADAPADYKYSRYQRHWLQYKEEEKIDKITIAISRDFLHNIMFCRRWVQVIECPRKRAKIAEGIYLYVTKAVPCF